MNWKAKKIKGIFLNALIFIAIFIFVFVLSLYAEEDCINSKANGISGIARHPDIHMQIIKPLIYLPTYNINSNANWQIDLRGRDLSKLNIKDRLYDLMYSDFDSTTKWPDALPKEFDPSKIMELGKTPGLNVKKLHEQGITGKGIGIAIIDKTLLVDHVEYKDRLKLYEEIHNRSHKVQMHGAAVASISVGKTVGVAPDANLYYIASDPGKDTMVGFQYDFSYYVKAIERILEINQSLAGENKIRVISISCGFDKGQKGYDEVFDAISRAMDEGVFVITTSVSDTHNLAFHGLGRDPLSDPDDYKSYKPGLWWKEQFINAAEKDKVISDKTLLVPMDSRCTASPTGVNDYVFYRNGGWSWSVPYIAGLYALACQVNPDITPQEFWDAGINTGDTVHFTEKGKNYELKYVVNPAKLIDSIKQKKDRA